MKNNNRTKKQQIRKSGTGRKQSRSKKSQNLYYRILDNSPVGIYSTNLKGDVVYINNALLRMLEFNSLEEIKSINTLTTYKNPNDREALIRILKEKGTASNFEVELLTKTGKSKYVAVNATLDGEVISGMIMDISERKRTEDEFRKYTEEIEDLYNNAPCGYHSLDKDGVFVRINNTELSWLGYARHDLIGKKKFSDLLTDKNLEVYRKQFPLFKKRGWVKDLEYEIIRGDGSIMYVLLNATAITDKAGNFVMSRSTLYDLTDHKKIERSLLEAEERYKAVFENTGTATLILEEDMTISLVNKECEKLFGYPKEEVEEKKKWTEFVLKDDLERMKEYHIIRRATPEAVPENYEFRMLDSSRKVRHIYLTIAMIPGTKKSIASLLDITEQKNTEKALKESEERFRDLFENANDLIQVVDGEGKYLYVNRKWREMLGFAEDEIERLQFTDVVKKELIPHCMENFRRIVSGESIEHLETVYVSKDGKELYLEGNMSPSFKNGEFVSCRGIFRDVTGRKQADEALHAAEEELHNNYFIQSAIHMILRESFKKIPLEEVLRKALNMIISVPWIDFETIGNIQLVEDEPEILVMRAQANLPESLKKLYAHVAFGKCLCGYAATTQEIQCARPGDRLHDICREEIPPFGQCAVPIVSGGKTLGVLNLYLKEGQITGKKEEDFLNAVADTLAEIVMRKKAEGRIEYLAYRDALTGIPNRNLFIDRLQQGIARAEPTSKIVAVLITDIDRFKSVNDAYGTYIGDRVLNEIAERLTTAIRKGDTVARLGNDEFGIALLDVADIDDVTPVFEKIMKYISYPLKVNNEEITLTFSTGISIYPHDGKIAQDLLKAAGLALGTAKKEGKKTCQFYTEDLNVKASEFLLMEKNLYNAIQNEEFLLHYQPYWDINTQKMVGIEALIRWQSKDMGLVSPAKFIPVLEETGMIIEVGQWILRTATRQVKEWQDKGYPVVPVSVNLSLIQFRQKNLADMVRKIMGECGYYPSLLTLEITESAFIQDIEFTRSVLQKLKEIGVSVSIDDFGTGYSSLSHLKRLPIDTLKIDISFVREMVKDPDSASIVMAIISMAHTLQLKTIAEGIETEEQWKFLRLLRCDMGQGFYFSKPLPPEEVERLFGERVVS